MLNAYVPSLSDALTASLRLPRARAIAPHNLVTFRSDKKGLCIWTTDRRTVLSFMVSDVEGEDSFTVSAKIEDVRKLKQALKGTEIKISVKGKSMNFTGDTAFHLPLVKPSFPDVPIPNKSKLRKCSLEIEDIERACTSVIRDPKDAWRDCVHGTVHISRAALISTNGQVLIKVNKVTGHRGKAVIVGKSAIRLLTSSTVSDLFTGKIEVDDKYAWFDLSGGVVIAELLDLDYTSVMNVIDAVKNTGIGSDPKKQRMLSIDKKAFTQALKDTSNYWKGDENNTVLMRTRKNGPELYLDFVEKGKMRDKDDKPWVSKEERPKPILIGAQTFNTSLTLAYNAQYIKDLCDATEGHDLQMWYPDKGTPLSVSETATIREKGFLGILAGIAV